MRKKAVGLALFFAEGALIQGGLADCRLSLLEHKCMAASFGWPVETWLRLEALVAQLVAAGVADSIREEIVKAVDTRVKWKARSSCEEDAAMVKRRNTRLLRPYHEDPEIGDWDSPEYQEEMVRTLRALGWTPEDIKTDRELARRYARWLDTMPRKDQRHR